MYCFQINIHSIFATDAEKKEKLRQKRMEEEQRMKEEKEKKRLEEEQRKRDGKGFVISN